MKAVDTNIVVRLIVRDDEHQLQLARSLVAESEIFISLVCLVETLWVIENYYALSREDGHTAIMNLRKVPNTIFEAEDLAVWALDRWLAGGDAADMLLLVAARDQDGFVTFDKRLSRKAGVSSPVPIETLL